MRRLDRIEGIAGPARRGAAFLALAALSALCAPHVRAGEARGPRDGSRVSPEVHGPVGEDGRKATEEGRGSEPKGEANEGEDAGTIKPRFHVDSTGRPGVIFYEQEWPSIPLALSFGAPFVSNAFDFFHYTWVLFPFSIRIRVGPGRHREPAEAGFFEGISRPEWSGWWPLYEKMRLPEPRYTGELPPGEPRITTRKHFFWPFVTWERGPRRKMLNVRPFFRVESGPNLHDLRILYPLFSRRREGDNLTMFLFPLFRYRRSVHREGGQKHYDKDGFILPFFFWGSDTKEGKYFAFFPLGGMVKGLLGKRWIRFVLFPLYVETEDPNYHSWNILWPIFGWWKGDPAKGQTQHGWRFWPFYGHNIFPGKFDRRFFLWPLIHWWRIGLDTAHPTSIFVFFPFYGHMRSPGRLDYWNVLLLFAVRNREKRMYREVHFPWPFLSYTRAQGLRAYKFWPLYGQRQSNRIRHRFFLWPLYRFALQRTDTQLRRRWSFAYLFNITTNEWIETRGTAPGERLSIRRTPPPRSRRERRLLDPRFEARVQEEWEKHLPTREQGTYRRTKTVGFFPLFFWRRGPQGGVVFRALTLLPSDRQGKITDSYFPFTILYHYQRTTEGIRESRALFGLYRHRVTHVERRLNGMGLFDYDRHGRKDTEITYRRWQILKGLFAYERVKNRRRVKILWIPIGRIPKELREQERKEHAQVRAAWREVAIRENQRRMMPPAFDMPDIDEIRRQVEAQIRAEWAAELAIENLWPNAPINLETVPYTPETISADPDKKAFTVYEPPAAAAAAN